jgi:hypothetical protein
MKKLFSFTTHLHDNKNILFSHNPGKYKMIQKKTLPKIHLNHPLLDNIDPARTQEFHPFEEILKSFQFPQLPEFKRIFQ